MFDSTAKSKRLFALLFAAMTAFLITQIAASVHAEKYAGEPHTHNGVQCVFVVGGLDDDALLPMVAVAAIFAIFLPAYLAVIENKCAYGSIQHAYAPRAPPGR